MIDVVVVVSMINFKPFGRVEPFVFRLNFDVELVSKIEVSATKSTTIILGWSELLLVMKENPDFGFLEKVEIPKKWTIASKRETSI